MAKKKDSRLTRAGVSGYNKPKRTPNHKTKSHIVVAKEGDKIKTIRFGQQKELNPLKQDTLRILRKVRCLRLFGRIVKNGRRKLCQKEKELMVLK